MFTRAWSEEETDALRQLVGAGCTIQEICSVIKCRGKEAIRTKANALGMKIKVETGEIDKDRFLALMEARRGSNGS